MRKSLLISFFALVFIVACSQEENSGNLNLNTNENDDTNLEVANANESEPDYSNMFIYDINELSIMIAPFVDDPEASYPVYEVFIDQNTIIEGEKETLEELEIKDEIKVWLKNNDTERETAAKILIE